jgi:FtsH-binding integral membrane protein
MAVIMYPLYKKTINDNTFVKVLSTVFIITLILTLFVFFSKRETFSSLGGYLLYGLLALIIFQLMDIIFLDYSYKKIKIYGIITVILFSGFILYDTDVLLSKSITNPDYPVESMNLFLDILNLFSGISNSNK